MTMWPIVTFAPMVSGKPGSVCSTQASWTFEFSPTVINSLSPRSTAPHQTDAFFSSLTLPITAAVGAIQ